MQFGQEMLTLEDQHQAMYFSLEMVPSVGPAENNPQLLSLQLKQSTLLWVQEAIWLRRLMKDLGEQTDALTTIYEDNQGATELAKNAKYHDWTKHIEICHHFVREKVVSNEIREIYCRTQDMVADIMTKGLPKPAFEKLRDLLGVYDVV